MLSAEMGLKYDFSKLGAFCFMFILRELKLMVCFLTIVTSTCKREENRNAKIILT